METPECQSCIALRTELAAVHKDRDEWKTAAQMNNGVYEPLQQQLADLQAKLELKDKIIADCVADEGEMETAMEALGMVCYDDYGALQHDTVLTTFVKDLQAKLAAMESSHLIKVNEYGDRIVAFQRQLAEAQARVRELEATSAQS